MSEITSPPNEALLAAVDSTAARGKLIVSTEAHLSEQLGRLKDDCKKELRSVIGPAQAESYEQFHQRTKQRLTDLILFHHEDDGMLEGRSL